ncbi:MAG: rRNA adenine dimethylase [Chitinivibrionales bacterium]|nr:rRNA adenine dimethylase [Chitinivibrionales bacterium]
MENLLDKYARKLVAAGLADEGAPLLGLVDADVSWNREDSACAVLDEVFRGLSINSLLLCRPAEPYRSIVDFLASRERQAIQPSDCETRTFIHDLPVSPRFDAHTVIAALRRRKSLIVPGTGIVSFGTVSPEQAFVVFSSACFATFVKFFSDYLTLARRGGLDDDYRAVYERVVPMLENPPARPPALREGPFGDADTVVGAMDAAGKKTVEYGLVDSYFGNISYRLGDTIYISQTTSSLDELPGCIDPCPLDGSSCAGVTASSELTAHREVLTRTGAAAVLHGHPKFSVIMSMDCTRDDCEMAGECHRRCPHVREVRGVPIVPGEVGTGRYGLCNTVPSAMENAPAAIVYGHGVFTVGERDFTDAFATLLRVETECREVFFARVGECRQS